jgi:hypothetical protein
MRRITALGLAALCLSATTDLVTNHHLLPDDAHRLVAEAERDGWMTRP